MFYQWTLVSRTGFIATMVEYTASNFSWAVFDSKHVLLESGWVTAQRTAADSARRRLRSLSGCPGERLIWNKGRYVYV